MACSQKQPIWGRNTVTLSELEWWIYHLVFSYREKLDWERERGTERETDRQTDGDTHTHTHTHTQNIHVHMFLCVYELCVCALVYRCELLLHLYETDSKWPDWLTCAANVLQVHSGATLLHSSPHSGTLPVTCPVTCHKQNSSHELDASKQSPHGTLVPVTCPVTCHKQNSSHQLTTSKLFHVHHQSSNLSQTQQLTSIQHSKTVSAGHVHHQSSNLSQT